MVGKLAPWFKKTWELNMTWSIFKANDPHAKGLRKIHKGLTKQDHIIIVGGQETAWTETIIQLKMISTSLQRGHQTPTWDLSISLRATTRSGWERGLAAWIYGFIGPWWGMICLTLDLLTHHLLRGTITYTTHGLHLNSWGNKRLTQLIADSSVGVNASGIVITHSRVSPFLT
jgi:hypothetical protein